MRSDTGSECGSRIRRVLERALRASGELRLRRRLAAFLKRAAHVLDGDLRRVARAILREMGEEA